MGHTWTRRCALVRGRSRTGSKIERGREADDRLKDHRRIEEGSKLKPKVVEMPNVVTVDAGRKLCMNDS